MGGEPLSSLSVEPTAHVYGNTCMVGGGGGGGGGGELRVHVKFLQNRIRQCLRERVF